MNLEELFLLIPRSFPQDDANYPGIEALSPDERADFMLRHLHLHMSKRAGQLADLLERHDHVGGRFQDMRPIDPERALLEIVRKAIADAVMLAHIGKLTAGQVMEAIRSHHDPGYEPPTQDDQE